MATAELAPIVVPIDLGKGFIPENQAEASEACPTLQKLIQGKIFRIADGLRDAGFNDFEVSMPSTKDIVLIPGKMTHYPVEVRVVPPKPDKDYTWDVRSTLDDLVTGGK